jgi:CubicO group peptidase (beta-lactamase class C family)
MIQRRTFIASAAASAVASTSLAGSTDVGNRLRALAEQALRDLGARSLVYGVVGRGGATSSGVLGLTAAGRPPTRHTVFRASAALRPLLSTAAATHVAAGSLRFDQPIQELLPTLRVGDPRFRAVTVDHLLTHTSGLPDTLPQIDGGGGGGDDWFIRAYGASLATATLQPGPGEGFAPSRLALLMLAAAIEARSGTTFTGLMRRGLFTTLGMPRSAFGRGAIDAGAARTPPSDGAVAEPFGDLFSSLDDLLRLVRVHLGDGAIDGREILPRSLTLALREPLPLKIGVAGYPAGLKVARGWFVLPRDGRDIFAHGGAGAGASSLCLFCPDAGFGMAVLADGQPKPKSDPLRSFALTAIDEQLFDLRDPARPHRLGKP